MEGRLKRRIASGVVTALAAALVAAPASANVKTFSGNVTGGGKVSFKVNFQNGKAVQAGLFSFSRIPVTCDQGSTKVRYSTQNTVAVTNRKFHYDFNFGPGQKASINGTVSRSGKKANGNTKYGPANPSPSTNCKSDGAVHWTASR